MKILQAMKLSHLSILLLLAAVLSACTTPYPGYRNEGQGPDERLLVLVKQYQRLLDPDRPRDHEDEQLLVDGQRVINDLRKLHLDYPSHVPTLYTLASINYDNGLPERAGGYIDSLFAIQKAHAEAGILRSRIAIDDGNLSAANRVLDQQIRYRPDHAGLREASSAVAYLGRDFGKAREALEMASLLGAPVWRVAFNEGLIDEAEGKTGAAIANYQAALDENPEFQPAASRLAGLRAANGEQIR